MNRLHLYNALHRDPIETGMREAQDDEDRSMGLVCLLAICFAMAGVIAVVVA